MSDQEIIQRLDTLIAIQQLINKEALSAARATIREDKVNAAILDASSTWVPAGKLQSVVAGKTRAASRTVKRRTADLIALGVLEKRGGGPNIEYKATGLI
jgi:hypothetical protein